MERSARRVALSRVAASPWAVACLVLVVYGAWLIADFAAGHDARDFIFLEPRYLTRCSQSAVIRPDPTYHNYNYDHNLGYDGLFYYFIALDPYHASCYLDEPGYRYGRILYPLLARLLVFGNLSLIPWTMLLINLAAIVGGTLAIAAWLRRKGTSVWFGLIYGFYPGLFAALWRDLTEVLSYGLVAAAVYLIDFGSGRRLMRAAVVFALAALARETAVVFPVICALCMALFGAYPGATLAGVSDRSVALQAAQPEESASWMATLQLASQSLPRNWWRAAVFLLVSLSPVLAWRIFLHIWLSGNKDFLPALIPFSGLFRAWPLPYYQASLVLPVAVPGLICTLVAGWALVRRVWTPEVLFLLVNALVFVVLLPAFQWDDYYAAGRATAGVILAALLCVPVIASLTSRKYLWIAITAGLWMLPWYDLFPLAFTWIRPV